MNYQRQPFNDFDFTVTFKERGFSLNLNIPSDFGRLHLGGLNILKAVIESIVWVNDQDGMEKRSGFVKKLLRETRLRMKEEVTDFDRVAIEVHKMKELVIKGNMYQKWIFTLGKNTGYVSTYYVYSHQT
jgi:hypothetical protein